MQISKTILNFTFMKMKLSKLNYQRNGVSGDEFFSVLSENLTDTKGKFLITFEVDDNDKIQHNKTRVVDLDNLTACWRGDKISGGLQKELDILMKKHKTKLYELKKILN